VTRGDRIAVFLPNTPETLIAHIATYKADAVLVPLLALFGPMAIEHRLRSGGAKILVTDRDLLPKVPEVRNNLPTLEAVIVVDADAGTGELNFQTLLDNESDNFDAVETASNDPALIVYTSGTTGPPKGALHGHRLLLAEVFNLDFFPQPGDLFWTHCEWAYVAGSFTALYPTLNASLTIVNYERTGRFDLAQAFRVISDYGVTVIFAIASALRIMMEGTEHPGEQYDLSKLTAIAVVGESMGPDLLEWGCQELGVGLTENYGLTECDYSISNCSAIMEVREGSMRRATPGHVVEIIDEAGHVLPPDTYGEIAIRKPDPSMFLGYWDNPEATRARFIGDWLRSGDYATKDADGYFWFTGRQDDIIESGGYRIGPGEIEAALKQHAAMADADAIKGQVVKAFVTVKAGTAPDGALEEKLRHHVRNKLEAHAYPREIEFLGALPVGNTGKAMKRELRRRENDKAARHDKGAPA